MAWQATILPSSPRAAVWREIFGTLTVPVLSPIPVRARAVPLGEEREFYRLDVSWLTPEQRARLVSYLARVFQEPVDQVEREIADPAHGVPILAEEVGVPIPLRFLT